MRNDFTLRLEPSKVAGLTLDTTSALNLNPNYTKAQQFKATVDSTAGWTQRRKYIPFRGEVIVYSDRHVIDGMDYPGIKIGDGMAYVVDLPFVGQETESQIMDLLYGHINNSSIHVTQGDKDFWNNKLNYMIDGEKLILNRN